MRGEYQCHGFVVNDVEGSTPHAWGIHLFIEVELLSDGINPTCVGNTVSRISFISTEKDQPHMRGEYVVVDGRWPWR